MEKTLWFKRRSYGWGWSPANWQGWLVTLLFLGLLTIPFLFNPEFISERPFVFLFGTTALTSLYLAVCWKKGEKPKWQWGKNG